MRRDIDLLRLLQEGRSQIAADRKGESFKKVSEKLGLTSQPTAAVFTALLRQAIDMIDDLTTFFLAASPTPGTSAAPTTS